MAHRLTRGQHVGYALGSFGTGGFGTVPGLLLLFFLTDTLAVPAAVAGVAVLVPKVWDVVVDPFLGRRSDRSASERGTRRGWLLGGAVGLPVVFALTFAVPDSLDGAAAAAWVVVAFLGAVTAFSCFQVSYLALPAEVTDDYDERTTLMAWRVAFLTVAILLFGAGAPALVDAAGGGRAGYRLMGLVIGVLLGAGMLAAWWSTRRLRPLTVPDAADAGVVEQLRAAAGNRPFRLLISAFLLQALATGCMLAAAPYVATYVLGDSALTSVLFVALVGPAVVVMPMWARVGGRLGKHRGLRAATALFAVATGGLSLARLLPSGGVYALVALVGVAYAGLQLFPLAMLPDTVAAEGPAPRSGSLTGLWTAGETTGLALGPGALAAVLAVTGFVSSAADERVAQPDSAITGVVVGFGIVPAVLAVASLPFVLRYDLTAARVRGTVTTAPGGTP